MASSGACAHCQIWFTTSIAKDESAADASANPIPFASSSHTSPDTQTTAPTQSTMSLATRDTQQDAPTPTYAAGFTFTLFHASFYVASSDNSTLPSRSQRELVSTRRSKQAKTRDMRAKRLEVMPTIAETPPADTTYEVLSSVTRGLQDRARRQYQQGVETRSDQASLRCLEAATRAEKERAARADRESLRILEAATVEQSVRASRARRHSSRRTSRKDRVPATGRYSSTGGTSSTRRSPSRRSEDYSTDEEAASTTNAAAHTTALRIQALSTTLSSIAASFVKVESSPSTPSSSLFRLPPRPTYQRALDTDPGPGAAAAVPTRPTLFQRTLTAFPEVAKFVGATVPLPTTARPFARVESGAYSSDNAPSSGRPLRPVGESRSPSWGSEEGAGKAGKDDSDLNCDGKDLELYHETPSKMRVSRISSWTSEEAALAATLDEGVLGGDKGGRGSSNFKEDSNLREEEPVVAVQDDFANITIDPEVYGETPAKGLKDESIRKPRSPSWSNMEEALDAATDDCIQFGENSEALDEALSDANRQSVQESPIPARSIEEVSPASVFSDLDFTQQDKDQSPAGLVHDDHAESVDDDFDLYDLERTEEKKNQSPARSAHDDHAESVNDDFDPSQAHKGAPSHISKQPVQQSPSLTRTPNREDSASASSDFDHTEKEQDQSQSPTRSAHDDHTDSSHDDFDADDDDHEIFSSSRDVSSPSPEHDKDTTLPAATKTQQWLETQLASAMNSLVRETAGKVEHEYADLFSPTRETPGKVQHEYADLFSPTRHGRAGSLDDDERVDEEDNAGDVHFGQDGEEEEFEDWEVLER
ncbi:hypothetical protein CLAFUR0_02177 [Fulvia fulva]|nr:hypothetical protein CLAFUR0_02177 [Fulvia fulva]